MVEYYDSRGVILNPGTYQLGSSYKACAQDCSHFGCVREAPLDFQGRGMKKMKRKKMTHTQKIIHTDHKTQKNKTKQKNTRGYLLKKSLETSQKT